MDKDKIYIYKNESTLSKVIIVYNNGMNDQHITLGELFEGYVNYRKIKNEFIWFKTMIENIKEDIDERLPKDI